MPDLPAPLHLAVALDGAGWHPAAWREPGARPGELFTAGYWADLARQAEAGLADFITIEDSLGLQSDDPLVPDERTDRVRGRLDATLIAARVAPVTSHIGLVPTAVVTHTEPFHLSKAIATIDFAAAGRAGVRVKVDGRPDVAAHFGRREIRPWRLPDGSSDPEAASHLRDAFDEAADYVTVLRQLWDSWEDDAEIRDVAAGRFVDRDKLHYIDFQGRFFSVKGPSITPRPPQGQPVVTALGHNAVPYELIGRSADVGFVTPHSQAQAAAIVAQVRAAQAAAGRAGEQLHIFADLLVYLDDSAPAALARKQRLDELAGAPSRSDALIFCGTAGELADLLISWARAGLTGYRLRPAALPHDLVQITEALVPELQRRGAFRRGYEAATLRGLLGLPRPASRYAATA